MSIIVQQTVLLYYKGLGNNLHYCEPSQYASVGQSNQHTPLLAVRWDENRKIDFLIEENYAILPLLKFSISVPLQSPFGVNFL